MSAKNFFSVEQQLAIKAAIARAEINTSGEVRVHIDNKCNGTALVTAVKVFSRLKMHKTKLRNGVLFYLAVDHKQFAILGDKGINELVPADFWDTIRDAMLVHFQKNEYTEGLCKGIDMAGEKLKVHFPFQSNDKNELSNEVSFGKN